MRGASATLVIVDEQHTASDEIVHMYCCNEDVALCGEDLTGHTYLEDSDNVCPKCDNIDIKYEGICCTFFGIV